MEAWARLADVWWSIYWLQTIEISLFISVIYTLDRLFRLPPHLRYFLWLLALIKLFIPPAFSFPAFITQNAPAQIFLAPVLATITDQNPETSFSLPFILFIGWFLVIVLMSAIIFSQNLILKRTLRNADPVSLPADLQRALRIRRYLLRIFKSKFIEAPVLTGFWRPRLYLPEDYQNWSFVQAKGILAHELAHLEHRDIWILALENFALILFAANPFVWLLHKKLMQVRELRCDAAAIVNSGINPIDYSKLLYHFLKKQNQAKILSVTGNYFAENKQTLLSRFQHLLERADEQRPMSHFRHYLLVLLAAIALIPFSWQCSPDQSSADKFLLAPEPVAKPEAKFVAYDEPPVPMGGFAAIVKNLKYPELARLAGIEGKIILNVLVTKTGFVKEVQVLSKKLNTPGHQKYGFTEAATAAVKSVRWRPATKDGKPVTVWVGIPVVFKIKYYQDMQNSKLSGVPLPPPRVSDAKHSANIFVAYDSPPEPIGGFAAIQRNLLKIEMATSNRKKIKVIVNVLVGADGTVEKTRILKSSGEKVMDAAAMAAIKRTPWKPAMQGNHPVKVWVGIPVIFN